MNNVKSHVLGFLMDVSKENRAQAKKQIVDALVQFTAGEDQFFFYDGTSLSLTRYVGEVVGSVANFFADNINLPIALQNTLTIVGESNAFAEKHVFFVFDRSDKFFEYAVNTVFRQNHKERYECQIHLLAVGITPTIDHIYLESVHSIKEEILKHYDKSPCKSDAETI